MPRRAPERATRTGSRTAARTPRRATGTRRGPGRRTNESFERISCVLAFLDGGNGLAAAARVPIFGPVAVAVVTEDHVDDGHGAPVRKHTVISTVSVERENGCTSWCV